jgi:hypothetical protein
MELGVTEEVGTRRYLPGVEDTADVEVAANSQIVTVPLPQSEFEHRSMTACWSLPILLSPLALSVELLVRVIGLLLCEAKVVIIGKSKYIMTDRSRTLGAVSSIRLNCIAMISYPSA